VKTCPIGVIKPVPGIERKQLNLGPFGQIRRLIHHQPPALHACLEGHIGSLPHGPWVDLASSGDDVPVTPAETAADFLLSHVRAARGAAWDEGRGRVPAPAPVPAQPWGPALRTFAERRVRGVPEAVVRGLFAWDRGERDGRSLCDLLFEVPLARRVLALQARGRRCVCLLDDAAARAHGDPRHPTGLAFALHDLCHLEKFVAPEHHAGQVGFFRLVERALETSALAALDRELDDAWRADRDYVLADMNGSAVFLLAALKMRLTLAVRRRGGDPEAAVDVLLRAMGLPDDVRAAAVAVRRDRDRAGEAKRVLGWFEGEAL
jgi:hypothetical protein